MPVRELESVFRPTPPQETFLRSPAMIRAYGGAMGGGKSRAMCEAIFDYALDYPGLTALVARDTHTSIITSTRKTMLEQVIPKDDAIVVRQKQSGGEDYIELFNGSRIHFIGMDDPYRWYSSEVSIYALDEAQEIGNGDSEKVIRLISRLRERCPACIRDGVADCEHMPHKAMFSFNPENPGHWLQTWFIAGAEQTKHGWRKEELVLPGADEPIGDAEFVFALPTDNPYLSKGYLATLRGFPEHLRRRYLEGKWEFISGQCFFDVDALMFYDELSRTSKPVLQGTTEGDVVQDAKFRRDHLLGESPDQVRVKAGRGALQIWRKPNKDHRYVMAIDVSSGGAFDYSAIQVVDVEAFEQVAEWQGKTDPDLVAVEAYRIGRVFNNALAVPEITGGWGFSVDQELKRLRYPKLYTRTVIDRLSKRWTDKTGWDTSTRTRMNMLDTLERVLREREFALFGPRTVQELGTFVWRDNARSGKLMRPEAQPGCNDDLVTALAIAVTVAVSMTRSERPKAKKKRVASYPWQHAA